MTETQPFVKEYVYKSTLSKVYGLTPTLIAMLGAPDKEGVNPHYRSGPPTLLYKITRVEAFMDLHRAEIEKARALRPVRSARGKAAAEKRREQTLAWARAVEIICKPIPADIVDRAAAYYAADLAERDYTWHSDNDFEYVGRKGVIAYIRHNYTNYESHLRALNGPAQDEAYWIIKDRVNALAEQALSALESSAVEQAS